MTTSAPDPPTLARTLMAGRGRLEAAGIAADEAAIEVNLYARTILGWDRARLLTQLQEHTPDGLEPRFSAWIARREQREPSAYIVGTREFWGLDFQVSPAVLIPRPESELIVEEAVARLQGAERARIADIGTGSGVLAIAIAHTVTNVTVVATDISRDALAVAARNALALGVCERVTFVQTSYLAGVAGMFDLIVANPPYVKEGDKPALSPDVRHEPDVALFGGADGLRDLAGVLDTAGERLAPGGRLVMEFGYGQEENVEALVATRPALRLDGIRADLQGIARTAIIERVG